MRRDQLEHAIRTACQIIGQPAVAVVGSQSILGTYREDQLPAEATMSVEVDILPLVDGGAEAARLADLVDGVAGEWSPFEEQHGFSIGPVRRRTMTASTTRRCWVTAQRPSTEQGVRPQDQSGPDASLREPYLRVAGDPVLVG